MVADSDAVVIIMLLQIAAEVALVGLAILCGAWTYKKVRSKYALRCTKCGYSLKGLTEPRCPECGELFNQYMVGLEDQDKPSNKERRQ